MYENDEVDVTGVGINNIESVLSGDLADEYHTGDSLDVYYIGFNTQEAPFDDPDVRNALSMAIDREFLASEFLLDLVVPANGILPPHVPGYDPERKLPEPDLAAARKLLSDAGYPNGMPQTRKPVMWLANSDQYRFHAELIQADLRQIGIAVELKLLIEQMREQVQNIE